MNKQFIENFCRFFSINFDYKIDFDYKELNEEDVPAEAIFNDDGSKLLKIYEKNPEIIIIAHEIGHLHVEKSQYQRNDIISEAAAQIWAFRMAFKLRHENNIYIDIFKYTSLFDELENRAINIWNDENSLEKYREASKICKETLHIFKQEKCDISVFDKFLESVKNNSIERESIEYEAYSNILSRIKIEEITHDEFAEKLKKEIKVLREKLGS